MTQAKISYESKASSILMLCRFSQNTSTETEICDKTMWKAANIIKQKWHKTEQQKYTSHPKIIRIIPLPKGPLESKNTNMHIS